MKKVDRKPDTIKEAIERAKKNYCLQEKEITEEGKIIYLSELEKLHLEQFKAEGIDEDLAHPKERYKELIADLRYLGNSAFPRLKAGKKWGEWTLEDVLKYFAKIVDTLRGIYFPILPPKKGSKEYSSSYWKCYREAEKYMKSKPPKEDEIKIWERKRKEWMKKLKKNLIKNSKIEKQSDPYLEYPKPEKPREYVIQHHWRGRSVHSDLRIKVNDYLLGWTIMDQIKGVVKEPVTTLGLAKKYDSQNIFKIDWEKGVPKLRPGIKPGFKEKYAELAAARKSPEPVPWLNVEGVVPKGEVGATKEFPGVFHIIDKGYCEFGAQKSYYHEYFFSKGKLKGRWFFRQLRPAEFRGTTKKAKEVIPPARETKFREEAPWFFIKPVDETPYVISDAAVEKKWIPPFGISALPEKIRKKIPKEFQYWNEKDEKKRIEIRDKLVKTLGEKLIEKKLTPGMSWARAAYRYVLSKQVMTFWRQTPLPGKIERVRQALASFMKLHPLKKEWINDAIKWLESRPNEMKELIAQELRLKKSREVKWVLQHHWWRGQKVIRAGASVEHWDLRLDFPSREGLMHFVLTQNPLKNKEVTAIFKPCKYKEWLNFSGYIPPANERAKMTKEELAKFPPGIEEANPTKNTSAFIEILDKGTAIVYEDGDLFKKFDFKGKKLKGLWVFIRENTSKFWIMKKSELPETK